MYNDSYIKNSIGVIMIECKKCHIIKSEESFRYYRNTGTRKQICYECNYVHVKRINRWSDLSDEEKMKDLKRKFEAQVIRNEGCWDWKGFIRPDGYVRIKYGGRTTSIGGHVASYMIHHNLLDLNGSHVLHICDNRKCTNPDHLFLGTYSDNMIDMVHKMRRSTSKLSPINIRHIKMMLKNGLSCTRISKMFGVHRGTINDIKLGKTWSHV